MHKYENSIKCKYCGHFDEITHNCYLCTSFDRIWDRGNADNFEPYKSTSPQSRCSHFSLAAMEGIISDYNPPQQRKDGSFIVGIDAIPGLSEALKSEEEKRRKELKSGCYVATCVYGSYDCPQVWTLRRFRDEFLAQHFLGRTFIRTYYAISPKVVSVLGDTSAFRKFFRSVLDRFVTKLNSKGYENTPYNDRSW